MLATEVSLNWGSARVRIARPVWLTCIVRTTRKTLTTITLSVLPIPGWVYVPTSHIAWYGNFASDMLCTFQGNSTSGVIGVARRVLKRTLIQWTSTMTFGIWDKQITRSRWVIEFEIRWHIYIFDDRLRRIGRAKLYPFETGSWDNA